LRAAIPASGRSVEEWGMRGVSYGEEAGQTPHLQGKGMGKGCMSRQVLLDTPGEQSIWTQL